MEFQPGIVAILNSQNNIVGTGFLAGDRLILTCAHVIEQAGAAPGGRVRVRFGVDGSERFAEIDAQTFSPEAQNDLALLRVSQVPANAQILRLGNSRASIGKEFCAFGYAIVGKLQGIGARGTVIDVVDGGTWLQLRSQEIDHGMSGAPVLDEARQVVIGMVTKGKGKLGKDQNLRNTWTTFATTTETIIAICRDLKIADKLDNVENLTSNNVDVSKLVKVDPIKLRKAMHKTYDRYEFERLLKDNSLDYHDLPEGPMENKIMYCIDWFRRRQRYDQLVSQVIQEHPELINDLI